ncbi:MAG: hypothetical protein IJ667_08180 [Synergistaceae bacterium]|nr:hypothetical protein [Synergistaceae bacterium]
MSANLITFDAQYMLQQAKVLSSASDAINEAASDLKRASLHERWRCRECNVINDRLGEIKSFLGKLDRGIDAVSSALNTGAARFAELESRAASQADGLANNLRDKHGFEGHGYGQSGSDRNLPVTQIPDTDVNRAHVDGISRSYEDKLLSSAHAVDKTTKTFDDDPSNGTYGADQGDMANNKKGIGIFDLRWFNDKDIYAYVKQQNRYANYSNADVAKLLDQINSEGCGYVAMVNNIFVEYEGRETEFEKTFGFPMYDKNGIANYDYLLVDFYANTDDRYYLDEKMGATALVNDVILQYEGKDNDFRNKYGCAPLLEDGVTINPEARQKILDSYQDTSVVTMEMEGTTCSLENRMEHYMNLKGIEYSSAMCGSSLSSAEINDYLNNGKNVNIAVSDFNLYKENGKAAANDVGGHWMTITGIADDGRYIVSSWGNRYYLNPSELNAPYFLVTDLAS